MSPLKWVIQNNLRKSNDVSKLIEFLEFFKVRWEHIPIIPFDESPIEGVSEEGITIFYGSTGMTRRVHEAGKWKPGVFFHPERFSFEGIRKGFGEHLLNADSEVMTVGELLSRDYPKDELFFSRPAEDSKLYTGNLFYFSEMKEEWTQRVDEPQDRFNLETLVQIAKPKKIVKEVRHFVVNGKVSTSSHYGYGKMKYEVEQPDLDFAQEMAKLYNPAEVFTLDTCLLEDGRRKVVETNCFNSSGLYWTDVYKLVQDINHFLLERYS
jgi:hypothetical protein